MANDIIGSGWSFPPKVDAQGGIALTNDRSELDQAIRIILSTSPGQRVMRPTIAKRPPKPVALWRKPSACGNPGCASLGSMSGQIHPKAAACL
jgi:hypothetical protein